jgi:hypothetical protein
VSSRAAERSSGLRQPVAFSDDGHGSSADVDRRGFGPAIGEGLLDTHAGGR